MNELWVHGNDFSYENIHDDSGVRVVLYEHYQALEAERDRYKAALEWARLYIDAADHKGAHDEHEADLWVRVQRFFKDHPQVVVVDEKGRQR